LKLILANLGSCVSFFQQLPILHQISRLPRTLPLVALWATLAAGCTSFSNSKTENWPPIQTKTGAPNSTNTAKVESPKPAPVVAQANQETISVSTDFKDNAASAEVAPHAPVVGPTVILAEPVIALPPGADIDLWDRMRVGFKMNELSSPLVAEKEKYYLSKPEYLQRMFARGSRYLYFIMEEIDKRGMPMELALLPFVESAMNPTAMSSAKASGLWQFIPSTGRQYNLSQNWWVDNRRDVTKGTLAALEYLQRIYKLQGDDWFLALASYNWGEGSVGRAMKSNAARGLPTDYISLSMPNETRHYVPKLIALKNIVMRAKELGIELPAAPNKPYFVAIEKTRPIDLKLAAQFAGMSVDEFVGLNPAHHRPVIAASKNNQILVPASQLDAWVAAVEKHEVTKRVFASWQPKTLGAGETLEAVAAAGGVSVAELRKANSLGAYQRILPGTRILAPNSKVQDEQQVESFVAPRVVEAVSIPAQVHVVRKKETLGSIAKQHGISVATLKAWNGIKKNVRRGMNLVVRQPSTQTVLTTETGSRQVIGSQSARPIKVALQVPEAKEPTTVVKCAGKSKKRCKTVALKSSAKKSSAKSASVKVKKSVATKQNSKKSAAKSKRAGNRSTVYLFNSTAHA
jgi:membrane-bound lytic murein transglycosylase D